MREAKVKYDDIADMHWWMVDHIHYLPAMYNPQNEMFPPRKTKCSKSKTKCLRFRHPPKPYKNSVRTAFLPNSNAISISTYQYFYPIKTSRLSISANFKPQSLAALKSSFSSTASMATSTSALARSEKYFSVFCF